MTGFHERRKHKRKCYLKHGSSSFKTKIRQTQPHELPFPCACVWDHSFLRKRASCTCFARFHGCIFLALSLTAFEQPAPEKDMRRSDTNVGARKRWHTNSVPLVVHMRERCSVGRCARNSSLLIILTLFVYLYIYLFIKPLVFSRLYSRAQKGFQREARDVFSQVSQHLQWLVVWSESTSNSFTLI